MFQKAGCKFGIWNLKKKRQIKKKKLASNWIVKNKNKKKKFEKWNSQELRWVKRYWEGANLSKWRGHYTLQTITKNWRLKAQLLVYMEMPTADDVGAQRLRTCVPQPLGQRPTTDVMWDAHLLAGQASAPKTINQVVQAQKCASSSTRNSKSREIYCAASSCYVELILFNFLLLSFSLYFISGLVSWGKKVALLFYLIDIGRVNSL